MESPGIYLEYFNMTIISIAIMQNVIGYPIITKRYSLWNNNVLFATGLFSTQASSQDRTEDLTITNRMLYH